MAAITEAQFLGSSDLTSHDSFGTARTDTGSTVVEADYDTNWGAGNANDWATALAAIHKWMRGTSPITNSVMIGDATTAGGISFNKPDAGVSEIIWNNAGINRWKFRVHSDENFQIRRLNSSGVLQDTVVVDQSDGSWSFPADLDVATDVRCRGVHVDGDEGTGIASTVTHTNVVDSAGDTAAAAIGNWRINGSSGTFRGWLKIWDGTTYVSIPCWSA